MMLLALACEATRLPHTLQLCQFALYLDELGHERGRISLALGHQGGKIRHIHLLRLERERGGERGKGEGERGKGEGERER